MKIITILNRVFVTAILCFVSTTIFADGAKVTPLMQKDLDDLTNQEGIMLIVEYAPGMSSKKHRHDAHVFVYVLEGSIIMQVAGSDSVTLAAGDTYYESPTDIHLISKNASKSEDAKFIVFFVKEKNSPASIPVMN